MLNGKGRWYRLTGLALVNLVLWVAIAAVAGLLISDQVDLGFETELRQMQATAIAAWEQLSERGLPLPGRASSVASRSQPTAGLPSTGQLRPTSAVDWSEPAHPPVGSPAAGNSIALQPVPASPGSSTGAGSQPAATPATGSSRGESQVGTGQGAGSGPGRPPAEPTQVLLTKPLLLADPEIHNLADLNAEMARSAPGRVVQIRYQEEMLNQEIATLCDNNPRLPFRNVHADLQRGQVVLTGEILALGFQLEATVTGTVEVHDCRPKFEIRTIAIAAVPTPQFVRDQVGRRVLEAMNWYPADYPLCLEQIVLEETRATIYGYSR